MNRLFKDIMNISSATFNPSAGAYTPTRFDIPVKGMTKASADAVQAADRIAQGEVTPEALVDLTGSKYDFQANAAVLKTMDDMIGTLLDTVA